MEWQLRRELQETRRAALAQSTHKNIQTHWKSYSTFCEATGKNPIPLSIDLLCLYAQYMSHFVKSPDTIRNYINGIITHNNLKGREPPNLNTPLFKLTMKGLRNMMQHRVHRAKPITPEILTDIHDLLNHSDPFHVVIWVTLLLGFLLLLRKSNLVPDTQQAWSCKKQLTGGNIKMSDQAILVTINWTKTIQDSHRALQIPLLKIPNSKLCPVSALENLDRLIGIEQKLPLLRYPIKRGWALLTYPQYNAALKTLVSHTGRDPAGFSTHSLRRGGATYAAQIGIPNNEIQTLGDWKSESYKNYIEDLLPARTKIAHKIKKTLIV